MAGVKFSRKDFEKYVKITPEIEEKISLFGTHLESLNENEIELEVTANRPDLYSLHGFMRNFLAFLGKETGLRQYKINKPQKDFQVKIDSSVKTIRPYTACAIIKNLKFNDSSIKEMIDIQEKIHNTLGRNRKKIAIGIYPLEKITLPITFKALKPQEIKFQPLEFDREVNGLQILQQHPTGREFAHLLEGKDKFPIFIDAKDNVLSMPPIINSHKTGKVSETTKDIFIECSGFDFSILNKTLNILVTMFADLGGEIYQMNLLYDKSKQVTPNLEPEKIKLTTESVNKLLGLELKEQEKKKLLEKAGYNYNPKTKIVEVPAWRTDIMHEVDIIEDIAIAYGYNNFIPEIPQISTIGEISPINILKSKIAEVLAGLNITEVSSYHLLTQDDLKKLGQKPEIEVEDSKSEYKYLRRDLITMALKTLGDNVDKEYPQRTFELGEAFTRNDTEETGIKEKHLLSIAIANKDAGFTEIKQTLDYLMRMLNKSYEIQTTTNQYLIEGRAGKIVFQGKEVGYFGELKPELINQIKVKMPIVILELDIEQLL
ncbi:phenylalanine--tRNA ligase subunit beta [Candidatus Pacearchaeota archaeon]|nr:phenylalanine--tRNA ligase subunit beta [Candidatus Pacearchaeota archaeon]